MNRSIKFSIVFAFMLIGLMAYGQNERQYTTAQINSIDVGLQASEGDLYFDSTANNLYIGLMSGGLVQINTLDDQKIDSFFISENTLVLSIEDDAESNKSVNLSPYLDNKDEQDLTLTGNTLAISNDPNTDVDLSGYVNTDAQDLTLTGNTLAISNDPNTDVDLSPYLDNTDAQDLTLSGNTLAISNDPNTDVDLSPYLDNTDAQDLTLTGNTLAISNDPNTDVDLSGYVNTDAQDLTLTGNTLAISNDPNTDVDLSPYLDNTDAQDLTLSGNTLAISNDPNTDVDLSPYLDNTDDQKIDVFSFDGTTLSLSLESDLEATKTLNLSSVDKNLYDDDGTLAGNRTVTMNGNSLTFDGTADVIIQNNGSLGVGTITPDARLDVEGGTVRFSDYGLGANTGTDTYQLAVDADGDVVEMNTVISSKIFYPPAVVIDVSMTGTGLTLDLHQEYVDRFGTPAVKNPTAPAAIPTYSETELDYYVTDYDTTVFANVSVSNAGIMTYDVIAVPASNCTYVNVVFVVK